jgi:hypothetical protein
MLMIVTRPNADGSYDTCGLNNRTLVRGYKTREGALQHGVKPYGNGALVRVEVYPGERLYGDPKEVFDYQT